MWWGDDDDHDDCDDDHDSDYDCDYDYVIWYDMIWCDVMWCDVMWWYHDMMIWWYDWWFDDMMLWWYDVMVLKGFTCFVVIFDDIQFLEWMVHHFKTGFYIVTQHLATVRGLFCSGVSMKRDWIREREGDRSRDRDRNRGRDEMRFR